MRKKTIKVGDIVRSQSGRLYRVNDILVPASGGHLLQNRTYDVTDLETGHANAFDGTEIDVAEKQTLDITITVSEPYVLVGGGYTGLRPQGIRRDYTATVFGDEVRNTSKDEIQRVIRTKVYRTHGDAVRVRFTFQKAAS